MLQTVEDGKLICYWRRKHRTLEPGLEDVAFDGAQFSIKSQLNDESCRLG